MEPRYRSSKRATANWIESASADMDVDPNLLHSTLRVLQAYNSYHPLLAIPIRLVGRPQSLTRTALCPLALDEVLSSAPSQMFRVLQSRTLYMVPRILPANLLSTFLRDFFQLPGPNRPPGLSSQERKKTTPHHQT